jgi:hypothetical protein
MRTAKQLLLMALAALTVSQSQGAQVMVFAAASLAGGSALSCCRLSGQMHEP